ncbi:hypothetical protein Dsin_003928 [Dipteronia sinensis]|uniref:SHSP domain-containing protein n=1 Tax=Dipteronia sinensis TaxID=43782 RepID=A0AAE0BA29_9ROSI|nr:hypothetical protein Dsin_003928 [Dipteronia sinensis]
MDAGNRAAHPQLKPFVALDGTADTSCSGPPVGLVDIGVSDGAYLFRVALPGVQKGNLKLEIERDGKVHIKGVMANCVFLENSSTVFQMKVEKMCPPGPFSISFSLPGQVDPRMFSSTYRPDGILEVIVRKRKFPYNTPEMAAGIQIPSPFL